MRIYSILRNSAPKLLTMRGVNIKLVRARSEGNMTVRKAPDVQRVTKITLIVTRLEYVSGKPSSEGELVGGICFPSRCNAHRDARTYSTRRECYRLLGDDEPASDTALDSG